MGNSSPMTIDDELRGFITTGNIQRIQECFERLPYYVEKPLNDQLWTPLMFACVQGQFAVVKFITQNYEVNLDEGDHEGMTALHLAIYKKAVDIVLYLCEIGANPLVLTQSGLTPKGMAYVMGVHDAVKVLEIFEKKAEKSPWVARVHLLWVFQQTRFKNVPSGIIYEISKFI